MLAEIDAFVPSDDGAWLHLDATLAEVFARDEDFNPAIHSLLNLFERFPRHDGHGVLWGVIHGLERIDGYQALLVSAVQRCPTELSITMLQRLLKSGQKTIGEVDVAALIAWGSERAPKINGTL